MEEDRKRKERNEFILGRLDQMRSCTALVAQNQFASILKTYQTESPPAPCRSVNHQRSVNPSYHSEDMHTKFPTSSSVDIPTKCLQEEIFLQQISKKYILIPKRDYYDSISSAEENTDWKSKYEILNHLKDIGKDSDNVPTRQDRDSLKTDNTMDVIDKKHHIKPIKYVFDEHPVKDNLEFTSVDLKPEYKTDLFVKNITSLQAAPTKQHEGHSKFASYDNSQNNNVSQALLEVKHRTYENNTKYKSEETFNVTSGVRKPQLINDYKSETIESEEKVIGHKQEDFSAYNKDNVVENEKVAKPNQNNYNNNPTETLDQTEITYDHLGPKAQETMIDENEYPIEMINASDFTPHDNVKLQDGVNINPEGHQIPLSLYNVTQDNSNYGDNVEYGEQNQLNDESGLEYNTTQQTVNYEYNEPAVNYETNAEYNKPETVPSGGDYEYNDPQTTVHSNINYEKVATPTQKLSPTEREINNTENPVHNETNNQIEHQDFIPSEPLTVENTVDEAAIEEFEAEQRDMFYDHLNGENIPSQEVYPENYQDNQYQYPESTQENVPIEINEHEEATQQYDQNYESQYGGYQEQPGYEQQQAYDQQAGYDQHSYDQQQVYDQQQTYDQQQVYDPQQVSDPQLQQGYEQGYYEQQQYDQSQYSQEQVYDQQVDYGQQQAYDKLQHEQQTYNETPQAIENQLDNEQGYVEPNHTNQDIEKEISQDTEEVKEQVIQEQVNANMNSKTQESIKKSRKEKKDAIKNPS